MNNTSNIHSCHCLNQQSKATDNPLMQIKKTTKSLPSVLVSVLIAFFPKCPVCWAVYMSMLGSIGLARLPYMPWMLPVLLFLLVVHLGMLLKKARHNGYLALIVSLAGAMIILSGRSLFPLEKWMLITGMVMIISGSLLNSFPTLSKSIISNFKN